MRSEWNEEPGSPSSRFRCSCASESSMVSLEDVVETLMDAFMLLSVLLYIRCQIVLYQMIRRDPEEKFTSYLYLVYFWGFVNLLVIANQIFFELLPNIIWPSFFYNLGAVGARIHFMMYLGGELFIVLSVAFTAISRYLTFVHFDSANKYWNIPHIRKFLFGILSISIAYASIYFFCDFRVVWSSSGKTVQYIFGDSTLDWVGLSIFIPFLAATVTLLSCIFCYWRVATIIRGTHTASEDGKSAETSSIQ